MNMLANKIIIIKQEGILDICVTQYSIIIIKSD